MIYSIVLYRGETALFPYPCDYNVCNSFIQRTRPVYYLVFISYFYRFGPHFNHLLCFSLITREIWKTSSAVTTVRQRQVRRQAVRCSQLMLETNSECKRDGNPCVHNDTTVHQCKYGGSKLSFRGRSKNWLLFLTFNFIQYLFQIKTCHYVTYHMTNVFIIKMKAKPRQ